MVELTIVVDSCDPKVSLIAGQIISGRVICQTKDPMDFELLTMTFSGFAQFSPAPVIARPDYFRYSILLAGGDQESHEVPAGGKAFPFQVQFPGNIQILPSSFEGEWAHVRYQLLAHLKRGLLKSDSQATLLLGFIAPFDLNALPETQIIRRAVVLQHEKTFGCCCFRCGSISMKIDIPKQGFVPGEHLRFKGQFFNKSMSAIKNVIVQLLLNTSYYAASYDGQYRRQIPHESHVLATIQSQPIEPEENFYWEGPLIIPDCPPTNLGVNCQIINVNYVLEFIMVLDKACSNNLAVQMPIVIGTVPLR